MNFASNSFLIQYIVDNYVPNFLVDLKELNKCFIITTNNNYHHKSILNIEHLQKILLQDFLIQSVLIDVLHITQCINDEEEFLNNYPGTSQLDFTLQQQAFRKLPLSDFKNLFETTMHNKYGKFFNVPSNYENHDDAVEADTPFVISQKSRILAGIISKLNLHNNPNKMKENKNIVSTPPQSDNNANDNNNTFITTKMIQEDDVAVANYDADDDDDDINFLSNIMYNEDNYNGGHKFDNKNDKLGSEHNIAASEDTTDSKENGDTNGAKNKNDDDDKVKLLHNNKMSKTNDNNKVCGSDKALLTVHEYLINHPYLIELIAVSELTFYYHDNNNNNNNDDDNDDINNNSSIKNNEGGFEAQTSAIIYDNKGFLKIPPTWKQFQQLFGRVLNFTDFLLLQHWSKNKSFLLPLQ